MTKSRSVVASLWSIVDVLIRQGTQFVVLVVLARLLTPDEFGIVAVMGLFTAVGTVFADGGLSTAIIRNPRSDPVEESTAFYLNSFSGLIIGILIAISGSGIAAFYSMPEIAQISPLMALSIPASALGALPMSVLIRDPNVRPIMVSGLLATVASAGTAIALASQGHGIWALAWQPVIFATVQTLALWLLSGWRPRTRPSATAARNLFGFGAYIFAGNILDAVYTKSYTVALGRFYTPAAVGIYNRADASQQFAVGLMANALGRVTVPIFSREAHDLSQLRLVVGKVVRVAMFANVPIMLLLAATGGPLIETAFGGRWADAVTPFQLLCLGGALWPLHLVNIHVLIALGKGREFLIAEVAKKIVGISLLAVGATAGLVGIATSSLVFSIIAFALNTLWVGKYTGYGFFAQVRDCRCAFVAAVPSAIASWFVTDRLGGPAFVELIFAGIAGLLTFVAISHIFQLRAWQEVILALRGNKKNEVIL